MRYKALILDLDGTTLPHGFSSHPSVRVKAAIARAQKFVHVSLATGRPLNITKPIIAELGIIGLCSVHDSTQLYDPMKDEIIDVVTIENGKVLEVLSSLSGISGKILIGLKNDETEYKKGSLPNDICDIAVPDISENIVDSYIEKVSKVDGIYVHKIPSWKGDLFWLVVSSAVATKLHAVVKIAELEKIKPEEIIGVGDSYNDYPLLSACGLKIAMGNAVPELKAIADFIAPTVDEDGVAVVIEKFILNQ
ncbi:HAD family phosphatase [Candidatus Gottesmanbacteria bacterium]|nr:HAD family phosphatase [Candidatus Gottesmanbacteria bacterium]